MIELVSSEDREQYLNQIWREIYEDARELCNEFSQTNPSRYPKNEFLIIIQYTFEQICKYYSEVLFSEVLIYVDDYYLNETKKYEPTITIESKNLKIHITCDDYYIAGNPGHRYRESESVKKHISKLAEEFE